MRFLPSVGMTNQPVISTGTEWRNLTHITENINNLKINRV